MTANLIEMNIQFGGAGDDSHRKMVAATDPEKEGEFKEQAEGGVFRVAANRSFKEIAV